MQKSRAALKIFFTVLFLAYFVWKLSAIDFGRFFLSLTVSNMLLSSALLLPIYFLSSVELWTLYKKIDQRLPGLWEFFQLNFIVNLFNFLLPFQGGAVFLSYYLKKNYGQRYASSAAVFLYSLSVSFVVNGVGGLIVLYLLGSKNVLLYLLFSGFIIHPAVLLVVNKMVRNLKHTHLVVIVETYTTDYLRLTKDHILLVRLLVLNLLNVIFNSVWVYVAASFWKMPGNFVDYFYFTFVYRVSQAVKVIPGNIGLTQMAISESFKMAKVYSDPYVVISAYQSINIIAVSLLTGTLCLLLFVRKGKKVIEIFN